MANPIGVLAALDESASAANIVAPTAISSLEPGNAFVSELQDEQELQERMAKALAKSQSTTLELLHDLPDADIAPPDNDLFVANLNPATQDGDLELIFSRFGPIKSCEIVRDWKTGDSLQYAFVIFENQRDCEEAYFKMHDCIIDDRRIVVNFSQSVAKLWNKHRAGGRISKEDIKLADSTKGNKSRGRGGKGKGKGDKDIKLADSTKGNKSKGRGGKGKGKGDKDSVASLLAASEGPKRKGVAGTKQLVSEDFGGAGGDRDRCGRDDRDRRRAKSRSRSRDRERDKRRHRG